MGVWSHGRGLVSVIGPGNGSPSATNVVLVVVIILLTHFSLSLQETAFLNFSFSGMPVADGSFGWRWLVDFSVA